MIVHPYKQSSKSAKALAKALGAKILKRKGKVLNNKVFLNWGRSDASERVGVNPTWINPPEAVALATDKKLTFLSFCAMGVRHVPWTTHKEEAQTWLDEGKIVFARSVLTGHSGSGITIVRPNESLPDVPLYSLYVKKGAEYRVHVFNQKVIDVQQKKRQNGAKSNLIRSHKNGYVFCREGVVLPDEAQTLARAAVDALGLHFGAVDIIHGHDGQFYVLEVNSAPGLEGQTVDSYAHAINAYL